MQLYECDTEISTKLDEWRRPALELLPPDSQFPDSAQNEHKEERDEVLDTLLEDYPFLRIYPCVSPLISSSSQRQRSMSRGGAFHE